MSLLAAAWTVASVKYLAESGVDAVTYYETTGMRGIIDTDDGCPLAEQFASSPGMVFPVYHVFGDLSESRRATIVSLVSSDALAVDGLAVRSRDGLRVLLACLRPSAQRVCLYPLPGAAASVRRLNEATAQRALFDTTRFRSDAWERLAIRNGRVELELGPFEVMRIDVERDRGGG